MFPALFAQLLLIFEAGHHDTHMCLCRHVWACRHSWLLSSWLNISIPLSFQIHTSLHQCILKYSVHLKNIVFKTGRLLLLVTKSCPTLWTLWDLMDCSPPGSSFHEISQAEYWSGSKFHLTDTGSCTHSLVLDSTLPLTRLLRFQTQECQSHYQSWKPVSR